MRFSGTVGRSSTRLRFKYMSAIAPYYALLPQQSPLPLGEG